jgi:hypothetical protein
MFIFYPGVRSEASSTEEQSFLEIVNHGNRTRVGCIVGFEVVGRLLSGYDVQA